MPLGPRGLFVLLGITAVVGVNVTLAGASGHRHDPAVAAQAMAYAQVGPAEVPEDARAVERSTAQGPRRGGGWQASGTVASARPRPSVAWVTATAAKTGIPERAVRAYASAQLAVAGTTPLCHLTWPTLAGIGWVESGHGSAGGARLSASGRVTRDIVGVALDGDGFAAVGDTDGGRLDGDPRWDRAVGPLQFIPSSWRAWGTDADADGLADPQDIDDAALSAARYLCAGGGDLRQPGPWHEAIRSYNDSEPYAASVLRAADSYARRSNG